jgi:hypothetical protein
MLHEKPYTYHTVFLPHDSKKREITNVSNSFERDFRRLFSGTKTVVTVLPRIDKQLSISYSKILLERCVFNVSKVKSLVDNLARYRKKWMEAVNRYVEEPYHNEASNYADAFRYLTQAVGHLETVSSIGGAMDRHRKAVEDRLRKLY